MYTYKKKIIDPIYYGNVLIYQELYGIIIVIQEYLGFIEKVHKQNMRFNVFL